jgi:hypothetical protein
MDFEFRFDDAKAFATRLNAAPQIVGEEMTKGVDRLTIQGEAFTKADTPVKTGNLRRSIAHKPATFGGGVARGSWGTATPYAKWVEEGRGPIVAGPGKVLRFEIGGTVLYRKRVRGAAGRFMFRNATARIRPMVAREFAAVGKRIVARMGI